MGTLVYPAHELPGTYFKEHTLRRNGTRVMINTIELRKHDIQSFVNECDRFVKEIRKLL